MNEELIHSLNKVNTIINYPSTENKYVNKGCIQIRYLLRENNFCKQVKENLLQCKGISSTVSTGKELVRDAQRSKVATSLCKICEKQRQK